MQPSTGRPPSTTHDADRERGALDLFARHGFEETTIDDIAAAVGVGRRTLFRYFPSKNDMVWGDFDWVLDGCAAISPQSGARGAADGRRCATRSSLSNRYPAEQLPELRIRMTLITTVPALQAHSMLRYAAWRGGGRRVGGARAWASRPDDLVPQTIAHAALGTSMAAFVRWVDHPDEDLEDCLDGAYQLLADGFTIEPPKPGDERAGGGAMSSTAGYGRPAAVGCWSAARPGGGPAQPGRPRGARPSCWRATATAGRRSAAGPAAPHGMLHPLADPRQVSGRRSRS